YNLNQLTFNSKTDKNPSFSFDGRYIVFDSNRDGQSEIYIMNADGSNQRRLTYNSAIDWDPVLSPDNSKIVFTSSRISGHDSNIFIMNVDGSNQKPLTNDNYDNADPFFTPDGRIIFHSNRDGNYEIYIMNPDGSNIQRLTNHPAKDILPSVSRDGTKVLFTSDRDGDNEIYVMNIDGGNVRQLTFNNIDDRNPVFSPDDNYIVFVRNLNELWIMNADGSNQRKLTSGAFPTTAPLYYEPPTPPCTTTTICQNYCSYQDITVGSIEITPYKICRENDKIVEMSVPVKLVSGRDDSEITARFYIEDDDGKYIFIGKDTHILDIGERKTFLIQYEYNAYDLSYGTHDVKVVVEGKDTETRYSTIRVERCFESKDIDVGFIWLNPEYPRSSDLVEGKVPITLKKAPTLPQNVYVEVRIDGKVLTESSLRFYHIETKDYKFYFNADKYGEGTHTIEVTAWIDGVSDTSMRKFTIDESSYYKITPEHCLLIKDFWVDNPLKEEQPALIKVRIRNCGLQTEANIESRLYIINKTMSGGLISLRPNEEKDISFTIRVPEDTTGVLKAKINVWNPYASDELEKDFPVKIGYPQVRAEKEYRVTQCRQQNISFVVKNVGEVRDTFVISFEGEPAKWISAYPKTIELDSEESRKIYADVNVPCDAKGIYQFTITAQGSPRYSVTSSMIVSSQFNYTGLFGLGDLDWLVLLLLLLLLLLALKRRKTKKPERCMGPHGC
ncbi:MAG: DUF5050 domain-containing protein, partial [Candidatus Anstonellales archaeon]